MRPIHIAQLDKARPVLILTREVVRPHLTNVTVAPITTTVRGLATEVPVDAVNGLNQPSVVSCDNIQTIPVCDLGRQIGYLLASQEPALAGPSATRSTSIGWWHRSTALHRHPLTLHPPRNSASNPPAGRRVSTKKRRADPL